MMPSDPFLFRFDLDRAITDQVIERLEGRPRLPLERDVGPPASGVYELYHQGVLVYVGKASKEMTKSGRTLKIRLNEHVDKISGRAGISLAEMQCRFLTFESEWWVFAAEFALIRHYSPSWNASGFGSKTPGAGRPGTKRISRWNRLFPPA